jgi:cation transport ATPase
MIGKKRSVLGAPVDVPLIPTGLTVFGMTLAIFSFSPLNDQASRFISYVGISLVYLAGGLPASSRALAALWKERALDIELLMVVAAVAASAVGAPFDRDRAIRELRKSLVLDHFQPASKHRRFCSRSSRGPCV